MIQKDGNSWLNIHRESTDGIARILHWRGAYKLSAEGAEGDRDWRKGVPLANRLGSLGERRELPQRGPGRVLAPMHFWHI